MSSKCENIEFLSTSETADILGLTQQRVCQLCKSGDLPSKMVGSVWVIRKDDAIQYKKEYPKFSRKQK